MRRGCHAAEDCDDDGVVGRRDGWVAWATAPMHGLHGLVHDAAANDAWVRERAMPVLAPSKGQRREACHLDLAGTAYS